MVFFNFGLSWFYLFAEFVNMKSARLTNETRFCKLSALSQSIWDLFIVADIFAGRAFNS